MKQTINLKVTHWNQEMLEMVARAFPNLENVRVVVRPTKQMSTNPYETTGLVVAQKLAELVFVCPHTYVEGLLCKATTGKIRIGLLRRNTLYLSPSAVMRALERYSDVDVRLVSICRLGKFLQVSGVLLKCEPNRNTVLVRRGPARDRLWALDPEQLRAHLKQGVPVEAPKIDPPVL